MSRRWGGRCPLDGQVNVHNWDKILDFLFPLALSTFPVAVLRRLAHCGTLCDLKGATSVESRRRKTMKKMIITLISLVLFAPQCSKGETVALLGEQTKSRVFDKSNDGDIDEAKDPNTVEILDYQSVRKPLYQARIVPKYDDGGELQELRVLVAFDGALHIYKRLEDIPSDFPKERKYSVRKETISADLLEKPLISELLSFEYEELEQDIVPIKIKVGSKIEEVRDRNEFIIWSTNELGNQVASDERLHDLTMPCASSYFEAFKLVRRGGYFEKEEEKDLKDQKSNPKLESLVPVSRFYAEFSGSCYKRFSTRSYLTRKGNSSYTSFGTARDEHGRAWNVVMVSSASFNVSGHKGELHLGFTLLIGAGEYSGCDVWGQEALDALITLKVLRYKEDGTVERTGMSSCLPLDCDGNTWCTAYNIVSKETVATINQYISKGSLSSPRS